ncbi:MAG: hypothetical protein ACXWQX_05520 [Bdellovibrio sp.]
MTASCFLRQIDQVLPAKANDTQKELAQKSRMTQVFFSLFSSFIKKIINGLLYKKLYK